MKEPKLASLGPALLARKGGAKPAMGRQLGTIPVEPGQDSQFEDLGWNDMGAADSVPPHDSNSEAVASEIADTAPDSPDTKFVNLTESGEEESSTGVSVVQKQQDEIVRRFAANSKAVAAPKKQPHARLQSGKRVAFTLRLDPDRHLKLRLACTMRNTSAQQLVTEAVDRMLGEMPELETLAAQLRQS